VNGIKTDIGASFYIEDNASSFLNNVLIANDLRIKPGLCNSGSGMLYIEYGAPIICFNDININGGITC